MSRTDRNALTAFDVAGWVREARRGSQAGYAQLYRRFAPLVHGILLGRFRPALADELSQECFANAFGHLAQLKEDHKFGPWIATIARRVQPPVSGRELSLTDVPDMESHKASPEDRTEAEKVLRAVMSLPQAYRETLLLRLAEGLTGPEIAAMTGLTPESVRVNLHRGMAKLRDALGVTPTAAMAVEKAP
ncbi:RNA polymerase sigma factor [Montanilutibacter psychrotolerans]|uniref:RNA polymerase sigma factor n=1 Tax=Montanilutibacter psychrotolerans TaxID=1327343 RepID=UPI0016815402|nr:sigma-70 family RNA polymerase sigma factor [Lysobacter psychrotolerans]